MSRYVCIHGHFYQPPRENPWLEAIELQDSAYPYHDWNERITDECYRPNARARMLDDEGWIVRLVNNYGRISFNFGPTVLSWMQEHTPDVYEDILAGDRESAGRFSGHGSAMAQAYNHMIMPLANARDRRTQVVWGVRDFQHRFGRDPEGMWLAETAVDIPTLEELAEAGIKFTVLAPRQAARVRRIGDEDWKDLGETGIDPSRAYVQNLPSGRSIGLFFYDGPVSQAVAFERLLNSGETFASRLMSAFHDDRSWTQLAHIATDGETYGHHHRHGEMALAYALEHIEEAGLATLTNYGEFLERFPPTHEVEIAENTSWSCYHGIERWRSDCGCCTGGRPGWNQAWRSGLREALDWLRDRVEPAFAQAAGELLRDPWAARDEFISVLLDRSDETIEAFFEAHATRPMNNGDRQQVLRLMELQRHAMLMYTSCGWFFDDLSGIETVQVMRYAGRVHQLARRTLGLSLETEFLERLAKAHSNIEEHGSGRDLFERHVKPSFVDLRDVAAHYAICSIFDGFEPSERVYCYDVIKEDLRRVTAGKASLQVGRARITSRITKMTDVISFGVLHLGDHMISAGARTYAGPEAYQGFWNSAEEAFDRADFPLCVRLMEEAFGDSNYSLRSLFRDEQRRVVERVLGSTLEEVHGAFRRMYGRHAVLSRFLTGLNIPVPRALVAPAEFVINDDLRRSIVADVPDTDRINELLAEATHNAVPLDTVTLSYATSESLKRLADEMARDPTDTERVARLLALCDATAPLPCEVELADVQNRFYDLLLGVRPRAVSRAGEGDERAAAWLAAFDELGSKLRVRVNGHDKGS